MKSHTVPWTNPTWTADAACTNSDPNLFYVVNSAGHVNQYAARAAKQVCSGCLVRAECLAWAVEIGDGHAVLGGTLPGERKNLRRTELRRARRVS